MNYGSDFQPVSTSGELEAPDGSKRIVSISFYDKLLCLWRS